MFFNYVSIYRGCPIAMFDYRRVPVYLYGASPRSPWVSTCFNGLTWMKTGATPWQNGNRMKPPCHSLTPPVLAKLLSSTLYLFSAFTTTSTVASSWRQDMPIPGRKIRKKRPPNRGITIKNHPNMASSCLSLPKNSAKMWSHLNRCRRIEDNAFLMILRMTPATNAVETVQNGFKSNLKSSFFPMSIQGL